jgi:hypothetical protein
MDDRTNFFVGWGTLSLINAGPASGSGRRAPGSVAVRVRWL